MLRDLYSQILEYDEQAKTLSATIVIIKGTAGGNSGGRRFKENRRELPTNRWTNLRATLGDSKVNRGLV